MNKHGRHIKKLCRKHGIIWQIIHAKRYNHEALPLWASSNSKSTVNALTNTLIHIIQTPPCKGKETLISFACALHEIGHCLANAQTFAQSKHLTNHYNKPTGKIHLTEEFTAWKFAHQFAGKFWCRKIEDFQNHCLKSYIKDYNSGHKRKISFKKFSARFFNTPT